MKVAIIEDDALGGACNYWGTIPSKTLRQLSRQIWYNKKNYDFPEMLDTAYEIVLKQSEIKKNRFAENEIDVFYNSSICFYLMFFSINTHAWLISA